MIIILLNAKLFADVGVRFLTEVACKEEVLMWLVINLFVSELTNSMYFVG